MGLEVFEHERIFVSRRRKKNQKRQKWMSSANTRQAMRDVHSQYTLHTLTHIHQNPWYFRHLTLRLCTCNHFVSFSLLPILNEVFFGKKCTLMRPFSIYCNKKMFDASILEFKKKWLTNRKIDVHKRSVWETQRDRRWKIIDSLPHCDYNEHCAYMCVYFVPPFSNACSIPFVKQS